jgi:CheY-like chemotaxis protein
VLVGCRRCGETVRVEVWDTGIGIPQDKHNDIFVEFFQMAPAGTLRGEGLGLGLAIVARLGQLLGHPINVASVPGKGSRFSITLAEVAPQPDVIPIAAPGLAPEDILQDLRLLIIDNDLAILESTAGLMRTWGCEVITAPSMNSALQNLGGFAPSLVIADIHLDHGEDGIFAVAALRQHFRRNIPAVLVSGDVSQQTRDRASLAGLVLLEKPVTPMRFRTVVTRSLQSADPPASTTSPGA